MNIVEALKLSTTVYYLNILKKGREALNYQPQKLYQDLGALAFL